MTFTGTTMFCCSGVSKRRFLVAKCAISVLVVCICLFSTGFLGEINICVQFLHVLRQDSISDGKLREVLTQHQEAASNHSNHDNDQLETSSTSSEEVPLPDELPVFWRQHPEQEILQQLKRPLQSIDIADPYNHSDSSLDLPPLHVNLSELAKFKKHLAYPEYFQELETRKKETELDYDEELEIIQSFPPLRSRSRALLIFTMDVFIRACRQYGWTYFLVGGSLLGAYRHHGLIPWDVDIDVAVTSSAWREVRHVLGNTPGFTLWTQTGGVWRFYLTHLPKIDSPSKWPFVEIYFFSEDDKHVWGWTKSLQYLMVDRQYVYPLATARWEHLNVTVPACTERLLRTEFDVSRCVSHYMESRTEGFEVRDPEGDVDCSKLYTFYPFVFRHVDYQNRRVVESRKVGNRVVEKITKFLEPDVCRE